MNSVSWPMSLVSAGYFSNQFFCGDKGTSFANRILDKFLVDKSLKNNKHIQHGSSIHNLAALCSHQILKLLA